MGKYQQNKTLSLKIHERRERVRTLHFQNHSPRKIARELKLSLTTVRRDLKFWKDAWQKILINDVSSPGEEIERLKFLESEAWKAWQESKRDATSNRTVVVGNGKKQKQKVETITRSRTGNVQLLDLLLRLILRRCEILGFIKAPVTDESTLHIQINGKRNDALSNSKAVECRRRIAHLEDEFARLVCEDSQPRTLEFGPTSSSVGPIFDGPGVGAPIEVDCADATPPREV
jgi:hypothetical protein